MCKKFIGSLGIALMLAGLAPASLAVPIVSIDLDPTTPGIQNTLSVVAGSTFTVDMVLSHDGAAIFDTVNFATDFNNSGNVIGLSGGTGSPTAGSLTLSGPPTLDLNAPAPLFPGSPMTIGGPFLPAPGFAGQVGSLGMLLLGGFIAPPMDYSIFSLTFNALTPGTSTIAPNSMSPVGPAGLLYFGSAGPIGPVPFTTASATVTVTAPQGGVPEPSILALFGLGLLGLGRIAGRRRR